MSARFDAAARQAACESAVDHLQRYVRAARTAGYHHPDLTGHDAQVWAWYDTESGLDLQTLDTDHTQLRAAAGAADEALSVQLEQLDALETVWTGTGADAAAGLLRRHCGTAAGVAAATAASAAAYRMLRDDLWRIIDDKATTTLDIDGRSAAQRPVWLAAAETVTTGVGDRPAAEEVIEMQVKPYVGADIATDWLTAMRAAQTAVVTSYDTATERVAAAPMPRFEIPGELGPGHQPPPGDRLVPLTAVPVNPVPGVAQPDPPEMPAAPTPGAVTPQQDADIAAEPAPLAPSAPLAPAGGEQNAASGPQIGPPDGAYADPAGSATPAGTSGLGGLLGQIIDAIGGLFGAGNGGLTDPNVDDLVDVGDPRETDSDDKTVGETELDGATDPGAADPGEPVQNAAGGEAEQQPGDKDGADGDSATTQTTESPTSTDPSEAVPAGVGKIAGAPADGAEDPAAPGSGPVSAPADPRPDAATPCEIAADELPQAGE